MHVLNGPSVVITPVELFSTKVSAMEACDSHMPIRSHDLLFGLPLTIV